jgi:hypothetical protein
MAPLATVERLSARVGEPIVEPADVALAEELLEGVSAWVRHYGLPWEDPGTAHPLAVTITLDAAKRGYLNNSGVDTERAEVSSIALDDSHAAGAALTPAEIRELRRLGKQDKKYMSSIRMVRPHLRDLAAAPGDDDSYIPFGEPLSSGFPMPPEYA